MIFTIFGYHTPINSEDECPLRYPTQPARSSALATDLDGAPDRSQAPQRHFGGVKGVPFAEMVGFYQMRFEFI